MKKCFQDHREQPRACMQVAPDAVPGFLAGPLPAQNEETRPAEETARTGERAPPTMALCRVAIGRGNPSYPAPGEQ